MKLVFAGPSLCGDIADERVSSAPDVIIRPPAAQGAIYRATVEGASVIGLVDGLYEDVAAPWHKEILYAIGQGVTMIGGASLGALRAAECAAYGMIGVGRVFEDYSTGRRIDDSDVAQLHAPEALGSFALTAALVNVDATIEKAVRAGDLSQFEAWRLPRIARSVFFKELTLENVARALYDNEAEADDLAARLERNWVDQKREDALAVVAAVDQAPGQRMQRAPDWKLEESSIWLSFVAREASEGDGSHAIVFR